MRDILPDRGQSSPFTGGIIPIYRRATSYCYIDVLLNHPSPHSPYKKSKSLISGGFPEIGVYSLFRL